MKLPTQESTANRLRYAFAIRNNGEWTGARRDDPRRKMIKSSVALLRALRRSAIL